MNWLNYYIEAVEENNETNGGRWADWDNADHIIDTYETPGRPPADDIDDLRRALDARIRGDM